MNIFILESDPVGAAQAQCDKHVVKMILESAQMLSTAHRMLDGVSSKALSKSGKRTVSYWSHETLEDTLYKAVHFAHPCTVWTMASKDNYLWHYVHWLALCAEYTFRYGKTHSSERLKFVLSTAPQNSSTAVGLTPFAQAMPDEFKDPVDPVSAYRRYYESKQQRFKMVWTRRDKPDWFNVLTEEVL